MENISVSRTLTVLMVGAFIAILNQTLLNVAIPHLMNDFNVSATTIQWLSTAYMLVNGILIPISAYLIESLGTRRLFIISMGLFTIGSVVCAAASGFSMMLIGRIIQAAGAGVIMPLVMTVFLSVFPPEKRGAAMGTMGIAMIFAPAIGPTLSGWIVENYTWRILFLMVIPLGVLDILLALNWLRNISEPTNPDFDFAGFLYSTIGFGSLLYGFSEAGSMGWSSLVVIICLIVGAIFILFFVLRQLSSEQPMLEFRVFKYDVFTITTIVGSATNMAMFGAMLLLPIYLQNIRGFTPLESGLLLMPGAILMGIMSPISGALFDRIGARPLAIMGLVITALTTFEFSKLTSETTYSHIMLLYTIRMFGMSLLMMTVQTAGLNQLPRHLGSHGTAMSNTMRQIAGSIGTALLVTVMSTRSTIHLSNYADIVSTVNPQVSDQIQQLGQGIAAMAGLPSQSGQALAVQTVYGFTQLQSAIQGIDDAFIWATWMAIVGLVLSFFIRKATPSQT